MTFALSHQVHDINGISSTIVQLWKQNTGVRFVASGILGNAVFFYLDRLLLPIIRKSTISSTIKSAKFDTAVTWIHRNVESVSFFVAYLLDIIFQRMQYELLRLILLNSC